MKNLFLTLIIGITLLTSCDKVDNPIPNNFVSNEGITWDDSTYTISDPAVRKIVMEEYTGQLCSNCPKGAKEIDRLKGVYADQFIPVSIHATPFAVPLTTDQDFSNPVDGIFDFKADYRTEAGNAYATEFGISGIPKGTVSRLNNSMATNISQWEIDIDAIKNDAPKVSMGLSVLYDDSSRTVKTIVNSEWLSSETGNYNLQILLLEDSIIGDQLDGSNYITGTYVHRDMLRNVNSTWGEPITSSNLGDSETISSLITIKQEWNKNHCIIVAFIYKTNSDYEIIQAEELHVPAQ